MGILSRAGAALARAFGAAPPTDAQAASRHPPVLDLPGVPVYPDGLPKNINAPLGRQLRSIDALLGLVTPSAGPTHARWSAYPATDLTPKKIIDAQRKADHGEPFTWAEMNEQIFERDGDLSAFALVRRQHVAGKTFRIVRKRGNATPLADSMRALGEAMVFEIESFKDSIEELLAANGQGWASQEIVWNFRPVRWEAPDGRIVGPVTLLCPERLEWVHGKHFRPDRRTDEVLLVMGSDNVSLPFGKFLFHRGEGQGYWERRGFMRPCVWYSAAKSWSLADWITFVHRFGIPTPYIQYAGSEAQYEEFKAVYEEMLTNLGRGLGAILPGSAKIGVLETPQGGRASDPHSALVEVMNASLAVRILGATLTTRSGPSGSYGLGDVHATVQHARELADAWKYCDTARRDLFAPFFWFNRLAIADVIGHTPDEILDAIPEMRFRIAKETSPQERSAIVTSAINDWGLEVDEESLRDEFDLDAPRPGSRPAPGKPQQVSRGGALVGAVEAARDGAEAPPDPPGATSPPPSASAHPGANDAQREALHALGAAVALLPERERRALRDQLNRAGYPAQSVALVCYGAHQIGALYPSLSGELSGGNLVIAVAGTLSPNQSYTFNWWRVGY